MSTLSDFIRDGCSARPEDKVSALAEVAALEARVDALEKALTQASAALASARQTLSNLAHGDLTGDQKQIALNAAANAAHAVVVAEAALPKTTGTGVRSEEET